MAKFVLDEGHEKKNREEIETLMWRFFEVNEGIGSKMPNIEH